MCDHREDVLSTMSSLVFCARVTFLIMAEIMSLSLSVVPRTHQPSRSSHTCSLPLFSSITCLILETHKQLHCTQTVVERWSIGACFDLPVLLFLTPVANIVLLQLIIYKGVLCISLIAEMNKNVLTPVMVMNKFCHRKQIN